jgi:uncharacterized repeat protein (TIGR01451 family)
MIGMTSKTIMAASALIMSAPAFATPLQLTSDVFVERAVKSSDGSKKVILQKPVLVTPGDNLVFVVHYKNTSGAAARNFSVTNPLPNAVAFNGTSDGLEIVSVDGGKSWGLLPALKVTDSLGKARPALKTDVTHIKWNMNQTLSPGSEGKLIFRGIVK